MDYNVTEFTDSGVTFCSRGQGWEFSSSSESGYKIFIAQFREEINTNEASYKFMESASGHLVTFCLVFCVHRYAAILMHRLLSDRLC